MPWTEDNPPNVAKYWPMEARRRCVTAANKALAEGRGEEDAIQACIGAGQTAMSDDATFSFRLGPLDEWAPIGGLRTVAFATGEQPSRRFKKELVRVGQYVKAADGLVVDISMSHLKNWVAQFQRMRDNGVRVPIPDQHRNAGSARNNMGWVTDLWIDGNTLWMSCEIIGDDALAAVARADVSLESPPRKVDGKGNVYERPIDHVALCTDPVVPGLGEFVELSFSLRMQEETAGPPQQERNSAMLEFLQELGALLGIASERLQDEATAREAVLEEIRRLVNAANAVAEAEEAVAEVAPEAVEAVAEVAAVEEQTAAMSLSPMIVQTIAENRGLKITRLVEQGKITPAVADDLRSKFIGRDNSMVRVALSQNSKGADFDNMIAAFEKNEAIMSFTQKSGPQIAGMYDARKETQTDGSENMLVDDAKAMAAERGG